MWREIYFLFSISEIKIRFVRFHTPNFIIHPLCLTLHARVCVVSQCSQIHRGAWVYCLCQDVKACSSTKGLLQFSPRVIQHYSVGYRSVSL